MLSTTDDRSALPTISVAPGADHRTQRQIEERMRSSSYTALRCVTCDHHEGVLILRGQVASYYLKQMAQELARRVNGVSVIVNRLEVVG